MTAGSSRGDAPPGLSVRLSPDGTPLHGPGGRSTAQHTRTLALGPLRLFVQGHCLADDTALRDGLRSLDRTNDPSELLDLPGAYRGIVTGPRGLTAFADLSGQFPVHYSVHGTEIAIGSDPLHLARLHDRAPDPLTVAARIAGGHVLPLWERRSLFQDVRRLGSGEILRITASGRLDIERRPRAAVASSFEEGSIRLRHALCEAVRLRTGSPGLMADLSGGLDSTSLALLAAELGRAPVHTVTYHHPDLPAGDLADAQDAATAPYVVPHLVQGGDDTLPYSGLDRLQVRTTDPTPGLLAQRRTLLRLNKATEIGGHGPYLTGEGGDAVLGAPPSYLAQLHSTGQRKALVRSCAVEARLHHASATGLFRGAVKTSRTSARRAFSQLGTALMAQERPPLTWSDAVSWCPVESEAAGWLRRTTRADLADLAASAETLDGAPSDAAGLASMTELRRSADTQRGMRELGESTATQVHAPFLDNRVVAACMSVPAWRRADPPSNKPLLRSALHGLVPDRILQRRGKGDYTREEYRGARLTAPVLRSLLRRPLLADLGVIEPRAVEDSLDRMLAGIPVPLGPLNELLAIEVWFRTVEEESR